MQAQPHHRVFQCLHKKAEVDVVCVNVCVSLCLFMASVQHESTRVGCVIKAPHCCLNTRTEDADDHIQELYA